MPSPKSFDPDKHCGAKTRFGSCCTNVKGFKTGHKGKGKCYLHGGLSTGPKTMPGKTIAAQNSFKHGLYSRSLKGAALMRYQDVKDADPAEILRDSFCLVHSKVLAALEGDVKYSRMDEVLLMACDALIEQGELSPEYVDRLKDKLVSMEVSKLSQVLNSTVNLANASIYLDRMGDMKKQLTLSMDFMKESVRLAPTREMRELAVSTLSKMKLEAGLPIEELSEFIREVREQAEAEAESEVEVLEGEVEDEVSIAEEVE